MRVSIVSGMGPTPIWHARGRCFQAFVGTGSRTGTSRPPGSGAHETGLAARPTGSAAAGSVSGHAWGEAMVVRTYRLRQFAALSQVVPREGSLCAVYGVGGGCTLSAVGESVATLCIPIMGAVQIHVADLTWTVAADMALATSCGSSISITGQGRCRWLALIGSAKTWQQLLMKSGVGSHQQLWPNLYVGGRELRRLAISAVRAGVAMRPGADASTFLGGWLSRLQEPLLDEIGRCPGRTLAAKARVYLRLQRVRNFMCANHGPTPELSVLAARAHYSPYHFVRTFHLVYHMTPHTYLIRQRMERAWRLLTAGALSVGEIAVASGFDSRSTFCRAFHEHFGATATEVRGRLPYYRRAS